MPQTTTSHRTAVMPTIVASARSLVPSDATRSASTLARHAGLFGAGSAVDFDACETLFIEGDSADWLYEVVGGSVCTYKLMLDGRRQITAFHFPGDLLGLRVHGQHVYGAEAITRARLRRYAHAEIDRFVARSPDIARHLLGLAEDELTGAQEQMLLLGRKSAREKVLSFLLARARHEDDEGYDTEIDVPMTRADIADYLGLTVETVSRTFTALREEGLIETPTPNRVVLAAIDRIEDIAGAY